MSRFLIECYTNWCGEDNTFSAIANTEIELEDTAAMLSYENFSSFDGIEAILEELFPDAEGKYTDSEIDKAVSVKEDYYGYTIREWDETRPEEEWDWYELVYDINDEV